jgi:hypothetical protein
MERADLKISKTTTAGLGVPAIKYIPSVSSGGPSLLRLAVDPQYGGQNAYYAVYLPIYPP